jgi:hypothetical protein
MQDGGCEENFPAKSFDLADKEALHSTISSHSPVLIECDHDGL